MTMRLVSLLAMVAAHLCPVEFTVIVVIGFVLPAVPPIEVFPLHGYSVWRAPRFYTGAHPWRERTVELNTLMEAASALVEQVPKLLHPRWGCQ